MRIAILLVLTAIPLLASAADGPTSARLIRSVGGFSGPEAVRHDPELDVYYVSNFNGNPMERAANGFVSKLAADGSIIALEFMVGTDAAPFHSGRGMFIADGLLWVADIDGIHGFDRQSGEQRQFVDLTALEPGFLNDISAGPDGTLYVTDTLSSRIYAVQDGTARLAIEDPALGPPNGIAWDAGGERFLLASWGGEQTLRAWRPGGDRLEVWGQSEGGNFDGLEVVDDMVVVASQQDQSLRIVGTDHDEVLARLGGRPADIAFDGMRRLIVVPYVSRHLIEFWELADD